MSGSNVLELRWLWEPLSAVGIGLLVGLEREHARAGPDPEVPPEPHAKGARTFALIALLGYGSAVCGGAFPGMPLVALGSLAVLLAALHLRRAKAPVPGAARAETILAISKPSGEDVTTEVAALTTGLLGALSHLRLSTAVLLGLLLTAVLISKPWLRGLVPRLRRRDLTGTLQLLVAVLIVLPVVPDRPLNLPGALGGVLNPRSIVLFVVLTAGIGYVGYFMVRLLGPRRGLAVTGLVGGLTSSTAVTVAMGERAREAPELVREAAVATVLACFVMTVRVVVLAALVHPPLALRLLLPAAGLGLGYTAAALFLRGLRRPRSAMDVRSEPVLTLENPFELGPALKFGLLYVCVILVSRLAHQQLGARGLYLASLLAGVADVDPTVLASARMARDGAEPLAAGATAILLALASNTLVKSALAFTAGGRPYGMHVLLGHGSALGLGALALAGLWFA